MVLQLLWLGRWFSLEVAIKTHTWELRPRAHWLGSDQPPQSGRQGLRPSLALGMQMVLGSASSFMLQVLCELAFQWLLTQVSLPPYSNLPQRHQLLGFRTLTHLFTHLNLYRGQYHRLLKIN